MQNLIAKVRQACHDERKINREATELQLLALELCSEIEKSKYYKNLGIRILIDPLLRRPINDGSGNCEEDCGKGIWMSLY